jgi:TetR/AcrR family transcriptional repressor of nem operon
MIDAMNTTQGAGRRKKDPEATRETLLQCAFDEIYEHGYGGASLDRILANSGVTKGALYHHFGSKSDLAHAVIDELIRPFVLGRWVEPLRGADDPISALVEHCGCMFESFTEREMQCGCPLNNLTQELAATDDAFRVRLEGVFDDWRGGVSEAFAHGQAQGTVRDDVDPDAVAAFIVSAFEGMATTMKGSRDRKIMGSVGVVFLTFLDGLRPAADAAAA